MNKIPLHQLFEVEYGNSFDLNTLVECDAKDPLAVNFVSRTRENNGISAIVKRLESHSPIESGVITVAGSGNSVLESFIQPAPFYTGYHVFILRPKKKMTDIEKLFYCYCIRQNQYKYNFGRQANKTLKDILVPDKMPKSFSKIKIDNVVTISNNPVLDKVIKLNSFQWKEFYLTDLFHIKASNDELIDNLSLGGKTPYISSTADNNGILDFVKEKPTNKKFTITANRGGSVGEFFFQPIEYKATPVDVRILEPKFVINEYIGLFLVTILKMEKYRFNYSRKMGTDRLEKLKIKLPSRNGKPNFKLMEDYIKSLSFSKSIL